MDYLWLKALHVAAVTIWFGGMLALALTINMAGPNIPSNPAGSAPRFAGMRRWDRWVTTPAMIAVWALGLTLALTGGWFPAPWLIAKLVLVFLLSALHGVLSGNLRRLSRNDGSEPPVILRYAPGILITLLIGIVSLVVVKPF